MSELSRRAANILEVASASGAKSHGTAMVLDRAGSLRMMNLDGWTLARTGPGIWRNRNLHDREMAGTITVEGWSASDRCSISRISRSAPLSSRVLSFSAALRGEIAGNAATGRFPAPISGSIHFDTAVSQFELSILDNALRQSGGNKTVVAERLGIKRTTLIMKMRSFENSGFLQKAG